jgi:EpsD family peptidyl-prolyl cis-trans isomerase
MKDSMPNTRPALVFAVAAALALLAACGDKKDAKATQTAARVNKSEITVHQINFILQQQRGLRPEQADAAAAQILERLIDQELAVQKADDLKLDRDPRVVMQLEAVRRDVLARAYADRVGEAAAKPAPEEIARYYRDNPALFAERRIYTLQELLVEATPEQVGLIRGMLPKVKGFFDLVEQVRAAGLRFAVNEAVRPAEQLPLANLKAVATLKDGQNMLTPTPNGATVLWLASSRAQPVSEEQARPAIEQYLLNERRRQLLEDDRKALRSAAAVQYMGKFAPGSAASGAAAAPPAAAPAPAAPPASGALDPAAVSRGMGLK